MLRAHFLPAALWLARANSGIGPEPRCDSPPLAAVADSVAQAFDEYQFVFVGSTHGGKKSHDFLLCLLSRTALQQRVRDVVVEWANPVHQAVVDRYLLSLERLPTDSLVPVWFDADAPDLWARLTLIPEFYAAVQSINTRLELARRIRVLGGSEPVNWSSVQTPEDLAIYPFKTNWMVHFLSEHLARDPDRRVLVVYGEGHIYHKGRSIVAEVEGTLGRGTLFVVATIDDLRPNEGPLIAQFGDTTRPFFRAARNFPGTQSLPKTLYYAKPPLADYIDALMYLGPTPDSDLSRSIVFTDAQRRELARRTVVRSDPRRMMQLRFEARSKWFQAHPNELPPRP